MQVAADRTWTRRHMFALLGATPAAAFAPPCVSVVLRSGPEAFSEALDGVERAFEKSGIDHETVDLNSGAAERIRYDTVVAFGGEALTAMKTRRRKGMTVASMAMNQDIDQSAEGMKIDGRVSLDIPAASFLAELASLLPDKPRLGMIRNPNRAGGLDTGLQSKAKQGGVTLQVVECRRPEDLLPSFLSLRNQVDLLVALPDGSLYNAATAKPLIMASLENRLPVVGFSSSFVRAGAALGIYPDFREVGVQTGELAARLLTRGAGGDEEPRKLVAGVNQKVARLLGLEIRRTRSAELVVYK